MITYLHYANVFTIYLAFFSYMIHYTLMSTIEKSERLNNESLGI